jgi:hypothetical protein
MAIASMFPVGTAVDVDGNVTFIREEPVEHCQLTMEPDSTSIGHGLIMIRGDGTTVSPYPPNNIVRESNDIKQIEAAYNELSTIFNGREIVGFHRFNEVMRAIRRRYNLRDPTFPTLQALATASGGGRTAAASANLESLPHRTHAMSQPPTPASSFTDL